MEAHNESKDLKGMKVCYTVTERNGKSYWNRIGVAFTNRDGSLNVRLEAVPVSGQLQIRDYEPRDDAPGAAASSGKPPPLPRANGRNGKDGPLTELPF
jgi:hypothetical protein